MSSTGHFDVHVDDLIQIGMRSQWAFSSRISASIKLAQRVQSQAQSATAGIALNSYVKTHSKAAGE